MSDFPTTITPGLAGHNNAHDLLGDLFNLGLVQGLLSSRPGAGVARRMFYATDTGQWFRDDGSTWREVVMAEKAQINDPGAWIDARAKGAICNGTADDTTPVRAAFTALGGAPGVVKCPSGTAGVCVTGTITILDHQVLDLGDSPFIGDANNLQIIAVAGSHAEVRNGFITKKTGRTGVVGIRVNPTGLVHCNYTRLDHLRIEGNSAGDLMSVGIALIAGQKISTADMGTWYSRLFDIDVRWCADGILSDTDPSNLGNGANGTVGDGVRCGDCTVGWHIAIGDTHVWGFSAEGCGTGIWVEQNSGASAADNSNNDFFGARFEANTTDISVGVNCYYNVFQGDFSLTKVTDLGVATTLLSNTHWRHSCEYVALVVDVDPGAGSATTFTQFLGHSFTAHSAKMLVTVDCVISPQTADNFVRFVVNGTNYSLGRFAPASVAQHGSRSVLVSGLTPGGAYVVSVQYKVAAGGIFHCRASSLPDYEFCSVVTRDAN